MNNFGRKNISEETIVKALKKVSEGFSYLLVAEEFGVSKGLISHWAKRAGLNNRKVLHIKKKKGVSKPVQNWDTIFDSLSHQSKEV